MGAAGSRRHADEARRPLFPGGGAGGAGGDALAGAFSPFSASAPPAESNAPVAGQEECPICLGPLSRSATFALPCGHRFHSLCLASALQVSPTCPTCRAEVPDGTFQALANQLLEDTADNSALASELLVDLRSRGRGPSSGVSEEATIEALLGAAKRGDASKLPSIAALLGRGAGSQAQPVQPLAVRLAAVEALRALVPTFPDAWVGHAPVLSLLRGVATSDPDEEVKCAAMRCLGEVGRKGEEASFLAVRCALEDRRASSDLRDAAANALQALSIRGDISSMRLALLALKDPDISVHSVALATLKQVCGPQGCCPDFLSDLAAVVTGHDDAELRGEALELVAQMETQGGLMGIGIATAALEDRSEEVAGAALVVLRRLCKWGDADTAATLVEVAKMRNKPEALRGQALAVVTQIARPGDQRACMGAAALISDPESSVAQAAGDALKKLAPRGDVEVTAAMLALLRDTDSEVRRMAAEVLGFVGHPQDTQVTQALQGLARSEDYAVSMAAEKSLGQLR